MRGLHEAKPRIGARALATEPCVGRTLLLRSARKSSPLHTTSKLVVDATPTCGCLAPEATRMEVEDLMGRSVPGIIMVDASVGPSQPP